MRVFALIVVALTLPACEGGEEPGVITHAPGTFDSDVPGWDRTETAARRGDPDARFDMALFNHWLAGDHEAAVAEFRRLAEQDHPAATGMMAMAYMHGQGVPEDHDEAARWLERAAALGVEGAAEDLAAYRARQP